MKVILYIILLLIDMSLLCKVESFIEKKEEITENEEHPLFASFIECIAEDTNLQYAVQYYRFFCNNQEKCPLLEFEIKQLFKTYLKLTEKKKSLKQYKKYCVINKCNTQYPIVTN